MSSEEADLQRPLAFDAPEPHRRVGAGEVRADQHEGVLAHVRFQREGFCIAKLDDGSIVKGRLSRPEVGLRYQFHGAWVSDARYGRQFAFRSYRPLYPQDPAGIRAYLMQHGPGIGPKLSQRLVEKYASEALEVCRTDPDRVAREVQGMRPALAQGLADQLLASEDLEAQHVALAGLFAGLKVPRTTAERIVERYGKEAEARVREEPYALVERVRGIGFATADAIARRTGVAPEDPRRVRAGILHVLGREATGQGHTCLREITLATYVSELLGVRAGLVGEGIEAVLTDGTCRRDLGLVALTPLAEAEQDIARRLRALAGARPAPGSLDASGLARDQARALERALTEGVFVLTGPPGTGKTYTIRRILDAFPDARIELAAPTGKAAKRITEQTGRSAQTVHRLLEPIYLGDRFGFARSAEQPLELDLLILDEVSMMDVQLMSQLLEAVPNSARLILVGDVQQLPAVGPGNVLGDMIRSGCIPYAELDEIKRQDEGWIIQNCHRIRRGERIWVDNGHARDFFVLERRHVSDIRDTVIELACERLPRKYGTDPLREQQVLVPLRLRTELSCASLNIALQARLNSVYVPSLPANESDQVGSGGRIRPGDKVIQTRNAYELGIFNGDLGTVERLEGRSLCVRFEAPDRLVDLDVERNDLELAYALTVHKFQGSEARIVVIPVHPSAGPRILQRSWLYTAISRARDVCVIVGHPEELDRIVNRDRNQVRCTRLESLLRSVGRPD